MKRKFELASNLLIFVLMLTAFFWAFFRSGNARLLSTGFEILKYFTMQSNIIVGLASLMSFILILRNKYNDVAKTIKYIAVGMVTLTLFTVLVYLAPLTSLGAMLQGPNSLMHLVIPVLAIAHLFLLEDKMEKYNFKITFLQVIPCIIYGIGYFINLQVRNGYGDLRYDYYAFGAYGLGIGSAVFLGMTLFMYGLGVGLFFGYKLIKIKTSKVIGTQFPRH